MIALPPPKAFEAQVATNVDRRKKLVDAVAAAAAEDFRVISPERGPVRGFGK